MYSLSKTYLINGLAWTWENPMLKRNQMDGCLGCLNEMIDHMDQFPTNVSKQAKMTAMSQSVG